MISEAVATLVTFKLVVKLVRFAKATSSFKRDNSIVCAPETSPNSKSINAASLAPPVERILIVSTSVEVNADWSSSATVTVKFSASLPAPPVKLSPSTEPAEPENVSSPAVPTKLSVPVVSVKVEPTTGVGVVPLPVVVSIVAGVTVVLLVALTAVPPKVKPVTPPVVANLVATVPLDPVSSGHEAL